MKMMNTEKKKKNLKKPEKWEKNIWIDRSICDVLNDQLVHTLSAHGRYDLCTII